MGTVMRDVLEGKTASVGHHIPRPQISELGGHLAWVLLGINGGVSLSSPGLDFLGGKKKGQKVRYT